MMCYCKYTVGYRRVTGIIEADRRENKRRRSRAAREARGNGRFHPHTDISAEINLKKKTSTIFSVLRPLSDLKSPRLRLRLFSL